MALVPLDSHDVRQVQVRKVRKKKYSCKTLEGRDILDGKFYGVSAQVC